MTLQPSADSFGIRRLAFKCSWWHPRVHSCQVSWFDQDSPGFVMPVLVLFRLREKY